MIIAIIAALSFYLLPVLLGLSFWRLLRKKSAITVIDCFTVGGLLLLVLFASGHFLSAQAMPLVLQVLAIVVVIPGLLEFKGLVKFLKINWKTILGISLLGSVVYGFWRFDTAYPLPLNWDFFHHQTLVNQLLAGNFSLIPSQLSDTFIFNGYTTLFHLLLAWPERVFTPQVLDYFWWLEYFHLLTTLFVSYWLAKSIVKSELVAWITVLLSAFIFESFMVYGSLIFIPQTLLAMVFAGIAAKFFQSKSLSLKDNVHNYLFLLPLHFVIGAAALGGLALIALTKPIQKLSKGGLIINGGLILLLLLILATPWINLPWDLNSLNQGEAKAFNLSIQEKINYLRTFSGYLLFLLVPIGIVASLISKNLKLKTVLLIAGFLVWTTVLPVPYSFKFYVLGRYFIDLLAAFGLVYILERLTWKPLRAVVVGFLVMGLSLIFVSGSNFIKNILKTSDSVAQISRSELEAAAFLKANYDKNAMLISDPATQHILEPLSGVNTPGGAYANRQTRSNLDEIGKSNDSGEIKVKLQEIEDTVVNEKPEILLLALSGRCFIWQDASLVRKMDLAYNVWAPASLNINNHVAINNFLAPNSGFKEVFRNDSIAILQLNL